MSYLSDHLNNQSSMNINLLELSLQQGFNISGPTDGAYAGISVSGAGDYNGDGYADILVGADNWAYGDTMYSGASFIIFGGPQELNINLASLTSSEGVMLYCSVTKSQSGVSVSDAGDVNADGFDDVLIAATIGESYLVYGTASPIDVNLNAMSPSQGVTMSGGGSSVSGAGDFNGDGFNDFLVGYTGGNGGTGEAFLIYGGADIPSSFSLIDMPISQGFAILGEVWGDSCGAAVSGAGDFNGDGYADVVIGAPDASPVTGSWAGTGYLVFGSPNINAAIELSNFPSKEGFQVWGPTWQNYVGLYVSGAGDFNGDGYDDFILGGTDYGYAVYIIWGFAGNASYINLNYFETPEQGVIINAGNWFDDMSVGGVQDFNSDGYSDVIVGVVSAGTVSVVYGSASPSGTVDLGPSTLPADQGFTMMGTQAGGNFGVFVAGLGDFNGDGQDDIIMGADYVNVDDLTKAGAAYVVYGGFEPTPSAAPTQEPSAAPTKRPTAAPTMHPTPAPSFTVTARPTLPPYAISQSPTHAPTLVPTAGPTVPPTLSPNPTEKPTFVPSAVPTLTPTHFIGVIRIRDPSSMPSSSPTNPLVPVNGHDYAPVISRSQVYALVFGLLSSLLSFFAGYIFREKIAFHILCNWGYKYTLLIHDVQASPPPPGTVGIRLKQIVENEGEQCILVCRVIDKYVKLEVANGNNNGISQGLYDLLLKTILQASHQRGKATFDDLALLHGEKNQLRDFLLSRNVVTFSDFGVIKGNIYKWCIYSNYKRKHAEKYQFEIRLSDSDRITSLSDSVVDSTTSNPMSDDKDGKLKSLDVDEHL